MSSAGPINNTLFLELHQPKGRNWQAGQILPATVVSSGKGEITILDIGGQRVSAFLKNGPPLTAGDRIQLEVLQSGYPTVLRLSTSESARDIVLTKALRTLLPRQIPLETLLTTLPSHGAVPSFLAPLVNLIPRFRRFGSRKGLEQAISDSGIFLENRLLHAKDKGAPIERDLKGILLRMLETQTGSGEKDSPPAMLRQQLEGSLARIQIHQINAITHNGTEWLFELPFREKDKPGTLQIRIRQEKDSSASHGQRTWHVAMEFELQGLGPLQVTLTLLDGNRITVGIWAESEETLIQLKNHQQRLREALQQAGLFPQRISHHRGRLTDILSQRSGFNRQLLDISV